MVFFFENFYSLCLLFSFSVGERPLPSNSTATKQKFSQHQNIRGGGLVLECVYILELSDSVPRVNVVEEVRAVVSIMEGNETVVAEE